MDERDERIAHLERALITSRMIGKAVGIVMERYGLDDDAAFQTLTRVASQEALPVRAVAARLIRTGQLNAVGAHSRHN